MATIWRSNIYIKTLHFALIHRFWKHTHNFFAPAATKLDAAGIQQAALQLANIEMWIKVSLSFVCVLEKGNQ